MSELSRRNFVTATTIFLVPPIPAQQSRDTRAAGLEDVAVRSNDHALNDLLARQNRDRQSRFYGGIPDEYQLYLPHAAAALINRAVASFVHPRSRFYKDTAVFEPVRLAMNYLERTQTPDGNFDLVTTNFNSPPDTAFVMWNAAQAAHLMRRYNLTELSRQFEPILLKAAEGMRRGGVHTPNHRWVICSALAQLYELFRKDDYVRRIDQWLAEGIDIDEDGHYSERSVGVYNAISDRAFVLVADKLNRPQLLDPVRHNLNTLPYYLHADHTLVTQISRRQDQTERPKPVRYWFPLRYLAVKDQNPLYAALLELIEPEAADLPTLLEHPFLLENLPAPASLPTEYTRLYSKTALYRIRHGQTSASLFLKDLSTLFHLSHGPLNLTVRLAGSFFGKGQFKPDAWKKLPDGFLLTQRLTGPYYQPLGRKVEWGVESWYRSRLERQQSEVCHLEYRLRFQHTPGHFILHFTSIGQANVPVAIECNVGTEGRLSGCKPLDEEAQAFVLQDDQASVSHENYMITFGPRLVEHHYWQVRGAEPKLPGRSVYLLTYSPLDVKLTIQVT